MSTTTERRLRYAIHDNTGQWLSEPAASKVDLIPTTPTILRPNPLYNSIDRSALTTPVGAHLPNLRGNQNNELGGLEVEVEGLSASGAGDQVAASGLSSTVWPIIEKLAGSTADGTGAQSTTGQGTGADVILDVGDGANFAVGDGILVPLVDTYGIGPSGVTPYAAAEVTSKSTDTLTVDRNWKDALNQAETPAASSTVYAARTAIFANNVPNREHLAFIDETQYDHLKAYGCAPESAQLVIDENAVLRLVLGNIRCSKWEETTVSGSIARTAPTTGSPIVGYPVFFSIGNDVFPAYDLTFDFGLSIAPRKGRSGEANRLGFVFKHAQPMISGKVAISSLSNPAYATQTLIETWAGGNNYSQNTYNIGLQIGANPGSCLYIRFPAGRFEQFVKLDDEGIPTFQFAVKATETGESYAGDCRIHLF